MNKFVPGMYDSAAELNLRTVLGAQMAGPTTDLRSQQGGNQNLMVSHVRILLLTRCLFMSQFSVIENASLFSSNESRLNYLSLRQNSSHLRGLEFRFFYKGQVNHNLPGSSTLAPT